MVSSSRNKHHALLESIPGVGRTTAKKIYTHYGNLVEMVTNWPEAKSAGLVGMKRFEDVQNFLNAEWVETSRKPLSSKTDEQTSLGDIT
jgi:ERCC4-type nuclease